jgi:hypothetical protein
MIKAERLPRRVRLELARDHDFPEGSRERGYDFIASLDRKAISISTHGKSSASVPGCAVSGRTSLRKSGGPCTSGGNMWTSHYDTDADYQSELVSRPADGDPTRFPPLARHGHG